MKIVIGMVLTLVMAVMFGCQSDSPRGGSSLSGGGFKIAAPTFSTEIKQGETKNVDISILRDDFFKQDLKMKVEASKGIIVEPTSLTIKASEAPSMLISISADKDAALGEYRVSVKGTPKTGEPTSTEFFVKVVAQ